MSRTWSRVGGVGIGVFALICAAAQVLRTDLDWLRAPLSFYLIGPHALWVRGAYFALAAAIVAIGVAGYRALSPQARSAAPVLMFVCGAIGLVVTALARTDPSSPPTTFTGFVHITAAQIAFVCTTTAMLLQSWRMRADPAWRARFAPAFSLAALCFIALWLQALRLDGGAPRGLTQKLLILAILGWLGLCARWLGTRSTADAPAARSS